MSNSSLSPHIGRNDHLFRIHDGHQVSDGNLYRNQGRGRGKYRVWVVKLIYRILTGKIISNCSFDERNQRKHSVEQVFEPIRKTSYNSDDALNKVDDRSKEGPNKILRPTRQPGWKQIVYRVLNSANQYVIYRIGYIYDHIHVGRVDKDFPLVGVVLQLSFHVS